MRMVVDRSGVLFEVNYTKDVQCIFLNSVRVLDERYRPVGPNLASFLLETYTLVEPAVAENVLSTIVGELG